MLSFKLSPWFTVFKLSVVIKHGRDLNPYTEAVKYQTVEGKTIQLECLKLCKKLCKDVFRQL